MKYISISRSLILALFVIQINACTPTQRPLEKSEGYVVLATENNQYRIEYFSKYKMLAEDYWSTTAEQLCPEGYETLYVNLDTLQFDMHVPIAGNNVNIGREEFIKSGEIRCSGDVASEVILTESQWREFNKETKAIKPVSGRWLSEALKLPSSHLTKLPTLEATQALTNIWGKPMKTQETGAKSVSIWQKGGDSWLRNQVALIEQDNCLKMVAIIPGVSAYMMGQYMTKDNVGEIISQLVTSGALPTYFYETDFCS